MKSQKNKVNLLLIFFDLEVGTNLIDIILYHWNILTHLLLQQCPMFFTTLYSLQHIYAGPVHCESHSGSRYCCLSFTDIFCIFRNKPSLSVREMHNKKLRKAFKAQLGHTCPHLTEVSIA